MWKTSKNEATLKQYKHDPRPGLSSKLDSAHSPWKGLDRKQNKKIPEWEPVWWPSELWPWNMVTNFDKVSSKKWIEDKLPDSPAVVIKNGCKMWLGTLQSSSRNSCRTRLV